MGKGRKVLRGKRVVRRRAPGEGLLEATRPALPSASSTKKCEATSSSKQSSKRLAADAERPPAPPKRKSPAVAKGDMPAVIEQGYRRFYLVHNVAFSLPGCSSGSDDDYNKQQQQEDNTITESYVVDTPWMMCIPEPEPKPQHCKDLIKRLGGEAFVTVRVTQQEQDEWEREQADKQATREARIRDRRYKQSLDAHIGNLYLGSFL